MAVAMTNLDDLAETPAMTAASAAAFA